MKKSKILKLSFLGILVFLILYYSFILLNQKEINKINVTYSAFGVVEADFLYDLQNKEYWYFSPKEHESRDRNAENQGYEFIDHLEDENIVRFLITARLYGFTHWRESYNNESIMDGDQWHIKIYFADGTAKDIYGSNAYPLTYEPMQDAFNELRSIRIEIE